MNCKSCKHWFDIGKDYASCDRDALVRDADFFCAAWEEVVEEVYTVREKPTNADRIRAMSDEELATFFGTLPCCPPGSAEELCFPENTCGADTKMMVKCWGTWLKSPVEDADEK